MKYRPVAKLSMIPIDNLNEIVKNVLVPLVFSVLFGLFKFLSNFTKNNFK
jgi:hypothetical protein